MKEKLDLLKKGLSQYRKAFIKAICGALTVANLAWWPAVDKINSLEIGEYPEEPAEIISARLQEMRPVIIRDAAVTFLLLFIIFFILYLLMWFKRDYNINLIRKLRTGRGEH